MNEEETKKALIDYHESYRRFPATESQEEREVRVNAITAKRAELFATAGKFDYKRLLTNLGFQVKKLGYDQEFIISHPSNPEPSLRILARSTNRTEVFVDDRYNRPNKKIHELWPSAPDSPDAVYQLLDKFHDKVPVNRHAERLAQAELNYLKNANTNK